MQNDDSSYTPANAGRRPAVGAPRGSGGAQRQPQGLPRSYRGPPPAYAGATASAATAPPAGRTFLERPHTQASIAAERRRRAIETASVVNADFLFCRQHFQGQCTYRPGRCRLTHCSRAEADVSIEALLRRALDERNVAPLAATSQDPVAEGSAASPQMNSPLEEAPAGARGAPRLIAFASFCVDATGACVPLERCPHGVQCRFVHSSEELLRATLANVESAFAEGLLPLRFCQEVVCRDFAIGRCARGPRCRYPHLPGVPSPRPAPVREPRDE